MAVSPRIGRWRSQNFVRAWWAAHSRVSSRSSPRAVVNQASWSGQWGELEYPHGPCNAPAQTDGTGSRDTWEAPRSQSGATRPGAGWETRGGATRHNGTIRQLQGWRRGSHPSVKNKEETNQHFIHQTETTNQNSKINHGDSKMLTLILFSTNDNLAKLC
jgi:hypothetical protein